VTTVEPGSRTPRRNGTRRRRGGRGEQAMVPEARFTSYYGRPVVRPAPWSADIPLYLFSGGLAAGASLLGAGADLTGRPALRRTSRVTALGALLVSFGALVHDLGRPARFHHMLRVAKPTSPMSVGTWVLTAYGPMAALAVLSEAAVRLPAGSALRRLLRPGGRAAGLLAAGVAPAVASYTAVLLSDTATPTWHAARRDLPVVFAASAAAAGGGAGMLLAPVAEADVARRLAVAGAVTDLAATRRIDKTIGIAAEPLHSGTAGRYLKAARALTAGGAVVAATLGSRSRAASVAAGAALLAGSWCTRFGIFHAGQQSARDPKYTVVPQRERLAGRG
jgi:formate-dependent nitrite reductase membrane component NrfD